MLGASPAAVAKLINALQLQQYVAAWKLLAWAVFNELTSAPQECSVSVCVQLIFINDEEFNIKMLRIRQQAGRNVLAVSFDEYMQLTKVRQDAATTGSYLALFLLKMQKIVNWRVDENLRMDSKPKNSIKKPQYTKKYSNILWQISNRHRCTSK